jgi:mannose-6-phosphate isomerase-like protein (cupin superfamily)
MSTAEHYLEIGERPWGKYYVLEIQPQFKVKKLVVKPHSRLSLQSHKHRSEHWVVVAGTATLEVRDSDNPDEWVHHYQPNDYCYIPPQAKHRISNETDQEVTIIETQCGSYTGEDDITRYEDDYGR